MAEIETGPGRAYIYGGMGERQGWTDLGTTDSLNFQFDWPGRPDLPAEPFASLKGASITVHGTDLDGWIWHHMTLGMPERWHRRHCRWCNPAAFSLPCPYGREYHRRQRARKRRRR